MPANSVSDIISKTISQRLGVDAPNVSIKEAGEVLNLALQQVLESKKLESVAEAVKKLSSSNGETQALWTGVMKSVIETLQNTVENTQKMLHEERERRLEEKRAAIEETRNQKVEEMNATGKLIETMADLQTKVFMQQMELLKALAEQIKSRQGGEPAQEDALTQKIKEKVLDALDKGIFSANTQDKPGGYTITQVKEMLDVVQALKMMFGPNTEGSNRLSEVEANLQIQLQRMKNEIETKRLEFEDKWKTEELREKYRAQEKRWEVLNNIALELSKLVPIAVESIKGGKTGSAVSMPVSMPDKRTICPQCGEDFSITATGGQCPRCGVQVVPQSSPTLPGFLMPNQGAGGVEV